MGSGVYTDGNELYRGYLDNCISVGTEVDADCVILCGGITNPQLPELSEAQSIKKYVLSVRPEWENKIRTDDTSLTSLQNLENALQILTNENITPTALHICCDSIRTPKNFYCAATLFNDYLNLSVSEEEIYNELAHELYKKRVKLRERVTLTLRNLHIEGMPLDRPIDDTAEQIAASLLEVGFIKYPNLHEHVIEYKKKIWGFE